MAYRSNSQAEFRLLPAINKENTGRPYYHKGLSEATLVLPSPIQAMLAQAIVKNRVRKDIPAVEAEKIFELAVRQNHSVEEFLKYQQSADSIESQTRILRFFQSETGPNLRDIFGRARYLYPEAIDFYDLQSGFAPNFEKVYFSYETSAMAVGRVVALIYHSYDEQIEYTVFKHTHPQTGQVRIWLGTPALINSPLNRFGVRVHAIDLGSLGSPLWEYRSQIPIPYNFGISHPLAQMVNYQSNWPYLREIPIIQKWYRENGILLAPVSTQF